MGEPDDEVKVADTYRRVIFWVLGVAGAGLLIVGSVGGTAFSWAAGKAEAAKVTADSLSLEMMKLELKMKEFRFDSLKEREDMKRQVAEIAKSVGAPVVVDTTKNREDSLTIPMMDATPPGFSLPMTDSSRDTS